MANDDKAPAPAGKPEDPKVKAAEARPEVLLTPKPRGSGGARSGTGSTRKRPPRKSAAPATVDLVGYDSTNEDDQYPYGDNEMNRILLVDLSERELRRRATVAEIVQRYKTIDETKDKSGGLTARQRLEYDQYRRTLDQDEVIDPFYREVVATLLQQNSDSLTTLLHEHGLMGSQRGVPGDGNGLDGREQEVAGVAGLLQLDNITEPDRPGFRSKVTQAQGEYRENRELFSAVFAALSGQHQVTVRSQIQQGLVDDAIVGTIRPGGSISKRRDPRTGEISENSDTLLRRDNVVYALSARSVAGVVRKLAADRVSAADPWLSSRIDAAFDSLTGVLSGGPASSLEIVLPDLEDSVDVEIVQENLHAVQAIYFSFMLEEARLFQVVERIVDLFRQGLLPLGRGKAGDYLFRYYKTAGERITEAERRDLYMRAFGAPGGDPNGNMPNREFNELWLRFVSAVSNFSRQISVEKLLRQTVPMSVSQEQVRKAARDLAANLSLHGYGIAYFAATDLQQSILEFRDLLSDPEVRGAFGARDMWQVVDQVNANYLGGTRNTYRYRVQANAGAIVVRWLAKNQQRLTGRFGLEVISIDALTNPQLRALGSDRPLVDPTDWDLVNACEQWLAVGGVQDQSIEQYSQPIESPVITSKPIEMPRAARDVLDSVGISLPGM
ncbi:hypothetical protein GCM10007860_33580 [Chitiniphilus shinanonensis]|uniref:Uncharacterized protein n=1 Tax=Chitiniphilus shinanonensis TaxID=553088 RepID=A0ABQ6BW63_9NEIS|nr:hypothetical protein [Chitiniphilus shinanonensis]GLS06188.1 hypothetical protein GCM10007860_33580 [Chitiniphilus shinanonensis]